MTKVLGTVIRLRKHREQQARRDHAQASQQLAQTERALDALNREIDDVRDGVDGSDAADVTRRHVYAIRLEMQRRNQERKVREAGRREDVRRRAAVATARETQVMQNVADNRAQEARREARRREDKQLDQAGLTAWWGKNA